MLLTQHGATSPSQANPANSIVLLDYREGTQLASSHPASHPPPKPAPVLPREIWDRILGPLGTLSLKTFRLVCREWSILGAERLYSTLYLNSYTKCWSGLIMISETGYATVVEKIVWNPIVLLDECVDGEAWASRYEFLLRGLNHSTVLRCYEQYMQIYNHLGEFLQPFSVDSISSISNALCKFTNCHELVVSEDYDSENRWLDPCFWRRLQNDRCILRHPSIWACRPHWWDPKDYDINIFVSHHGLLNAAARCSAITYMTVDLEPGNLNSLVESYTHVSCQYIESLGRQDDSDNSNDSFEVPQIVARAATDQSHLYMLPQNFDETVQAEIIPRPVMLPNLRTLRLANITLDMRYLLQILCMQPQLPHSKISIHLNGTIIFYGLSPHLLLDLLGRLNVDMHYEPLERYYCTDFPRYRGGPPYVDYSVGSRNLEELSRSSERLCGEAGKPLNMPTPDPKHSRMSQVKFQSRPSDLESIALSLMPRARREEWIYATDFTYQICIEDSHTVCEWVITRPGGRYDSFSSSTQIIVPILTSALYFNYEAYNPDREGDAVGMAHLLEGDLLYGHGSIEDQHLLAQFEVEHLDFDVIETRVLEPLGLDLFDQSQRQLESVRDSPLLGALSLYFVSRYNRGSVLI